MGGTQTLSSVAQPPQQSVAHSCAGTNTAWTGWRDTDSHPAGRPSPSPVQAWTPGGRSCLGASPVGPWLSSPAEQTRVPGPLCPQTPALPCPSGAECAAGRRRQPSPPATRSPAWTKKSGRAQGRSPKQQGTAFKGRLGKAWWLTRQTVSRGQTGTSHPVAEAGDPPMRNTGHCEEL